ncbi:MAG: alkene reductase [Neisseriaceae bacterium]
MSILFEPLNAGELRLKNRIIMAPLTRCRAGELREPTDLVAQYYAQRASAGMIISEATSISEMGVGYPRTPGIWSEDQVTAWRKVTEKVHKNGGTILLQLWHVGRLSDPHWLNGRIPVSASAVRPKGHPSHIRPIKDFVTPRALEVSEVKEVIADFKEAAINAKLAGFDGVEIHGANGYLLDQFLQDSTNLRTDEYGGSIEKRARLMLEVTDAVCEIWGNGRVGMHLAPRCDAQDMGDSNPLITFKYVAKELGKRKIAFICSRAELGDDNLAYELKNEFGGVYIINQEMTKANAEIEITIRHADACAWGKLFIANPDLVERFRINAELNTPDSSTFYTEGAAGYTDYPMLKLEYEECGINNNIAQNVESNYKV